MTNTPCLATVVKYFFYYLRQQLITESTRPDIVNGRRTLKKSRTKYHVAEMENHSLLRCDLNQVSTGLLGVWGNAVKSLKTFFFIYLTLNDCKFL